jgi:hypothetical protein
MMGIIISQFIAVGSAWNNGKSGSAYANTVENYDYTKNYGTHDWIADAALQALKNDNATKWGWLWERRTIYLLATEAPDNSNVNVTLNGQTLSGFGDTTYHHIYFNEDGSIKLNEDDAAIRAKSCGDLADVALTDEKLDVAAFYLGAMTHYIADMGMFAHTTQNNVPPHNLNFDLYHSTIEGYVLTRSDDYQNMEEFFKLSTFTPGSKRPYNASMETAWDSYKDPNPSESITRDAVWLHNNHFSSWATTYAARANGNVTQQLYYNRIEQSINLAVQNIAAAINYVAGAAVTSGSGNNSTTSTVTNSNTSSNDSDLEELSGYNIAFFGLFIVIGIHLVMKRRKTMLLTR